MFVSHFLFYFILKNFFCFYQNLLSDEQLASVPIAILDTKSDLEAAIDEEELLEELGLVSATEEVIDDEELDEEPGLVSATEEVIDDGELHEELGLVSTTEKVKEKVLFA